MNYFLELVAGPHSRIMDREALLHPRLAPGGLGGEGSARERLRFGTEVYRSCQRLRVRDTEQPIALPRRSLEWPRWGRRNVDTRAYDTEDVTRYRGRRNLIRWEGCEHMDGVATELRDGQDSFLDRRI